MIIILLSYSSFILVIRTYVCHILRNAYVTFVYVHIILNGAVIYVHIILNGAVIYVHIILNGAVIYVHTYVFDSLSGPVN